MSSLTSDSTDVTAGPAEVGQSGAGAIAVRGLIREFGDGDDRIRALGPVDLDVQPGEFVVLVGASGSGKSTLLRQLAGFDTPTAGSVTIDGAAPRPGESAGVVFQQPRLFPWRSVRGNVELALKYAGVARGERADRADGLLERVGLDGMADRRVWEISGGQQQRVAIARALAVDTSVVLMDEPFAALDALTRERLQDDVRAMSATTGRTIVFVTHSAEEAAFLGTRIVVLSKRPGRVVLDIESPLARDADPATVRDLLEFARLRSDVSSAIKSAAG